MLTVLLLFVLLLFGSDDLDDHD